jgi:hypothetical protein
MFKEPQNEKYKSKICKQFSEKLFCPYGNRCLFKHEDRSFGEVHGYHHVYKIQILKHCYPSGDQESVKDSLLARYLDMTDCDDDIDAMLMPRLQVFKEITGDLDFKLSRSDSQYSGSLS